MAEMVKPSQRGGLGGLNFSCPKDCSAIDFSLTVEMPLTYSRMHLTRGNGLGFLDVCALHVRQLPWAVLFWAENG